MHPIQLPLSEMRVFKQHEKDQSYGKGNVQLRQILENEEGPCFKAPLIYFPSAFDTYLANESVIVSETSLEDFDHRWNDPDFNPPVNLTSRVFYPRGGVLLAWAAFQGNSKLVQHIINLGNICINNGNAFGKTPLRFAGDCDNKKEGYLASRMLINAGADVNLGSMEVEKNEEILIAGEVKYTKLYCTDYKKMLIRCDSEYDPFEGKLESRVFPDERRRIMCKTPLWCAIEKLENLPLVMLLLLNGGMICRTLSKPGLAFLNKTITHFFEPSKLFLCGNQDEDSTLAIFPKELMAHIARIRTMLILETIVEDELEVTERKHYDSTICTLF